jgi:hypothetical protein
MIKSSSFLRIVVDRQRKCEITNVYFKGTLPVDLMKAYLEISK